MISHQRASDGAQGFLHRRDLNHDVCTVALLLDHLLQPPDLALDPAQPCQVRGLDCRVHCYSLALCSMSLTTANRTMRLLTHRHGVSSPCIPPAPILYIPHPPMSRGQNS